MKTKTRPEHRSTFLSLKFGTVINLEKNMVFQQLPDGRRSNILAAQRFGAPGERVKPERVIPQKRLAAAPTRTC
jgi:hypothetical protein